MKSLLSIEDLSRSFGGLRALNGVSFQVETGQIAALIGPNGAGKTTLFNVVTGADMPTEGRIRFMGQDIAGRGPDRICSLGIARTFQNIRLFRNLSVLDNARIGCHAWTWSALFGALLRPPSTRDEEARILDQAREALDFVGLADQEASVASALPYGHQRRLEIARALASRPKLMLLDEPAAGMGPTETDELMDLIEQVRKRGITIFLIEHDMKLVMRISDQIVVLDHGEKIAEGEPDRVKSQKAVIEAYLGSTK